MSGVSGPQAAPPELFQARVTLLGNVENNLHQFDAMNFRGTKLARHFKAVSGTTLRACTLQATAISSHFSRPVGLTRPPTVNHGRGVPPPC